MLKSIITICIIIVIIKLVLAGLKRIKEFSSSPKIKGKTGEWATKRILRSVASSYDNCFVVNDMLLKAGNATAQIDHVLVLNNLVYVVETKNYSGLAQGSSYVDYWMVNGNKMYSPFYQNRTHIAVLKDILESKGFTNLQFINVVSIPNRKTEVRFKCSYANENIIRRKKDLKKLIEKQYFDSLLITNNDIKKILVPYTKYSKKDLEKHIAKIKGKRGMEV